ncbi:phage major capsid protein, P2 family [Vogesella indigofera]|uniref:phage major capsid protein, P2 family n=1 Tax=Vogesella indigofera TaxID=45465 RepID=UPI00234EF723|nr:phage major capsid protein, P2 family [Vogesella indigofera]MDC7699602.1 phage major capsid protein, P2 family [Vogesella indigofera]
MKELTRKRFTELQIALATLNNAAEPTKSYSVVPTVQQTLEEKIQESANFLQMINIQPVDDQEGEPLGLYAASPVASRTDTSGGARRQPKDPTGLQSHKYRCEKTNFDTAINYAKLDAWSKFKDFKSRVRAVTIRQQARDRIMIGFNGTHVAATTDIATNPLLQDVNIGWLEKYRLEAEERVMAEVAAGSGKVKVGPSVAVADGYRNLDALVMDAVDNLIEPQFAEDTDLVVIVGRKLLGDKYFPQANKDNAPSEQLALQTIISQKRIGNLPAVRVPFFPDNALLITPLKNLSIYYQDGARRQSVKDEEEFDRIAFYESSNDAYVVENYEAGCLVENIELVAEVAA